MPICLLNFIRLPSPSSYPPSILSLSLPPSFLSLYLSPFVLPSSPFLFLSLSVYMYMFVYVGRNCSSSNTIHLIFISFVCLFIYSFVIETGSPTRDWMLLFLPPWCWGHKHVPPYLTSFTGSPGSKLRFSILEPQALYWLSCLQGLTSMSFNYLKFRVLFLV